MMEKQMTRSELYDAIIKGAKFLSREDLAPEVRKVAQSKYDRYVEQLRSMEDDIVQPLKSEQQKQEPEPKQEPEKELTDEEKARAAIEEIRRTLMMRVEKDERRRRA